MGKKIPRFLRENLHGLKVKFKIAASKKSKGEKEDKIRRKFGGMPEWTNGLVSAPKAHPPWAEKTMYYIYIIYSQKLNKKYTGITKNLRKRFCEHNNSKVPFTSKAKDWKLIYYEAFLNKQDAYAEEKFLKSGRGRDRLKYLLQNTIKGVGRDAGAD